MTRGLLFFFLVLSQAYAQPYRVVEGTLRQAWLVKDGAGWRLPEEGERYRTVFFSMNAASTRGNYLEITGIEPFSVWYGDRFLGSYQQKALFALDSLSRVHSAPARFAIHSNRGVDLISTSLIRYSAAPPTEELRARERPYFVNLCILIVLLLSAYFVLLFQSNPKLIMDYFNFSKLLSIQERDETLAAGRITSSINLMIYLFISLFFSFFLLIIFHFTTSHFIIANRFQFSSELEGLGRWLQVSALVATALMLKMAIVSFTSRLFRFREGYAIQVLNFFRQLTLQLVLLSIIALVFFVGRIEASNYYVGLVTLSGWVLIAWVALIFVKLLGKSPFSGFHLFSYLCATEIFPLVIFFEILFF